MATFQPRQARSQQTLDAILEACDRLLADRSFEKITMQDIAREAGVSVGNVYNRFKDKEALVSYMLSAHQVSALEQVRAGLTSVRARTLNTRIRRLTEIMAETIAPFRPLFATLASRQAQSAEDPDADIRANTDALVDELTNWLLHHHPVIDPGRARFALASIAFSLQFNLIFGTPARLFGDHYLIALSQQACVYLNATEESS